MLLKPVQHIHSIDKVISIYQTPKGKTHGPFHFKIFETFSIDCVYIGGPKKDKTQILDYAYTYSPLKGNRLKEVLL